MWSWVKKTISDALKGFVQRAIGAVTSQHWSQDLEQLNDTIEKHHTDSNRQREAIRTQIFEMQQNRSAEIQAFGNQDQQVVDEPSSCPPFKCNPGQFQCKNSVCIHPGDICDGASQCGDYSDEQHCNDHVCLSSQFKCPGNGTVTARCIPWASRCDANLDCPNGEDEKDCPSRTCPSNHLKEN